MLLAKFPSEMCLREQRKKYLRARVLSLLGRSTDWGLGPFTRILDCRLSSMALQVMTRSQVVPTTNYEASTVYIVLKSVTFECAKVCFVLFATTQ